MWTSGSATRLAITPPASFTQSQPTVYAGDSREMFVSQVKELQKSDPGAKEQWIAYTDIAGQGTRDPNKHSQEFLEAFLAQLQSGNKLVVHEEAASLSDVVKMMQKRSGSFKQFWAHFCQQYGGGTNDPAKHEGAYHVKFFEYMAQTASGCSSPPMNPMAFSAPPMAMAQPPVKRMRMDTFGGGMSTGMDSEKEACVMSVKAFQRMGAEQKEVWGSYSDKFLGGVRDPSRHDVDTLQEFMNQNGVPQVSAGSPSWQGGSWGAGPQSMGGGGGSFGGGPPADMSMDPAKEALVSRIKVFQKSGTEQRDAWYGFCGATRDPARHTPDKLQEFIGIYGIP